MSIPTPWSVLDFVCTPVRWQWAQLLNHPPPLMAKAQCLLLWLSWSLSLLRGKSFLAFLESYFVLNFASLWYDRESPRVERPVLNPDTVRAYPPSAGPTWILYYDYWLVLIINNHLQWTIWSVSYQSSTELKPESKFEVSIAGPSTPSPLQALNERFDSRVVVTLKLL